MSNPKPIRKISTHQHEYYQGHHRFEHWQVDNHVYFITARCRGRYPAFASDAAKAIFWDRFNHYTAQYQFAPWVTTLLDNHYHTLGYLRLGRNLSLLMQRLHGSVAKLVNDILPQRRRDFWRDHVGREYFDGCIRDEKQCRLAYRYTLMQAVRHGVVNDAQQYAHTRVQVELERGVKRALELGALMPDVPYPRYARRATPGR